MHPSYVHRYFPAQRREGGLTARPASEHTDLPDQKIPSAIADT